MEHPETYKVIEDQLPPGQARQCPMCGRPVGAPHEPNCTLRVRTVVVRATVEFVSFVPVGFNPAQVNYMKNESMCGSALIQELALLSHLRCLCGRVRYQYVREASTQDEQENGIMHP